MLEFLGGSVDRQFQAGSFMGDRNRLVAFWPRFQLAAQIMGTGLVAVLVPQVDLDACQVLFITFERALNGSTYPLLQSDAALNMVIAVDLDLHSSSLISASSREAHRLALGRHHRDLLLTQSVCARNNSTPE
ncbi:hypothetical protein D3C84_905940 [compost metagenome]